ncbi:MAG: glycosyltransferase family 2 protein [bacterium]
MEKKEISVIIPVFNEEKNIDTFIHKLIKVLVSLEKSFEVIVIDDGSVDQTFEVLKKIKSQYNEIKIIQFRKNFGQSAALDCGFKNSLGKIIIAMDGDGQNDPEDIPKFLEKIDCGYDLVSGWRKKRKGNLLCRKIPSFVANKFIYWISKVKLHDFGCTFKAYKKEIIEEFHLYGEMHRFIPALINNIGIKIAEIEVKDNIREFGKSKYGNSRILKVCIDLIKVKFLLTYSINPMQIFGGIGFFSLLFSFILGFILCYNKLIQNVPFTRNPFLLLTVFFGLIGVQFIILGLLAEMLTRIYYELQNKSTYTIRKII